MQQKVFNQFEKGPLLYKNYSCFQTEPHGEIKILLRLKPLSVTTNVVGLQPDDAGHVGQNRSAHVAHVVGLQTDANVVTETRLN